MQRYSAFKAAFLLFAFQALSVAAISAQHSKIDSLKKVLEYLPQDTSRVRTLNLLAYQYFNTDFEKLKFYADQALALALRLEDPLSIGNSYLRVGSYYYLTKNVQVALSHYQKAIEYYTIAGNRLGIASGYSNLGKIYVDMGNYPLAYEYYLKASKEAAQSGNTITKASIALSMGNLLEILKKYEEGVRYYNQALDYYRQTKNREYEALVLHNMGNLYQSAKQYDKAISLLNRSLHIADSLQLYRIQGYANNTLAYTYLFMAEYDKALSYLQKALQISEQHGNKQSTIAAMQGIADVYVQQGKVNEAITYYKRALEMAKPQGLAYEKLAAYKGLADAYKKQGNYKLSLDYQSEWVSLKDSVFNLENTQKIDQLQASFEIEKKQAEIELLQKDREREDLRRNAIGAGLLALLLIAGLVVSRQRLKINKNRLLLEKSEELAQKNEQLAQQAGQLKELNETKSRFFANISHEFRTPLTLILNNLLDKIVQARQQASAQTSQDLPQLQVMYRNARRLLQLINQLLDLSKLESGRMKIQLADGDLTRLLHVVYDSFASLAESKNITFSLLLPSGELLCRFDADHIEKIFYNLLSNAFKFTPDKGEITLKAELLPQSTSSSLLQISVRDSGPGISPEHIGQVFNRFYQGDQSFSDDQGTGIGLALVKELVDLQGGRIWVESEKGKGALFILQLPYIPAEKPPFSIREDNQVEALVVQHQPEAYPLPKNPDLLQDQLPERNEDRPLILLVEDNQDMRNYICQHLQEKYQVIESENGLKGLEKAFDAMPDLIISDWMMPGLNGIELCARLKSDNRTSHIPVILLTALATNEGKLKGLETGADDYLTKPFDSRELNLRIRNLIESRRKLRERFSREVNLEPASITVTSTDEKFIQKVIKIVEQNMSDCEFSMEDFGSEVGMSRMQLHRKIKAITGKTPGDFLRLMRLKRAAQLLEMQAGNVSEVAYQVGFNNLSYFSKCFKEQFGTTPHEFISRTAMPLHSMK